MNNNARGTSGYMSVAEAAEYLRVSQRTIRRRIDDGTILVRQARPRCKISIPIRELM